MEKPLPGIYRHFKGNLYRVWGVVCHSETQEWMVLYQALHGNLALWVRPLSMFAQAVEQGGRWVPRFQFENTADNDDVSSLCEALKNSLQSLSMSR